MKSNLLITIALALFGLSASAQYTKILDFAGIANGRSPYGDLIFDGTFLYGMTQYGGTNDSGIIFKVKPDGTGFAKLFDFNSTNGAYPLGTLISDGTFLYGTTSIGGSKTNCFAGCGVLFKIKTDGTGYSKLHDFTGIATSPPSADGARPTGNLITDGTYLYGPTYAGGSPYTNDGTIFKIKTDGTGYVDLFDFNGSTGYPPSALIFDGTYLYGMTENGGASNDGVIYRIKTDGTGYVKLYSFGGVPDGYNPSYSLISDGIFLYGMTMYGGASTNCMGGCGIIFKINANATGYLKLHDFGNALDGNTPLGSLVFDGTYLYGMTQSGGGAGNGMLFKIKQDGTGYGDLLDFAGATNGSSPTGSLFLNGGCLYGMTSQGGANDYGTIFKYGIATDINENNIEAGFNMYPNPSSGNFIFNSKIAEGEINIFNLIGEKVYSEKTNSDKAEIDLSNRQNGIYFVHITSEKGSSVKKIIINR